MRPSILFYCQHSLGMGHLVRSMALAAGLTERFRVVFLNGGPLPKGIKLRSGVEIIDLPPLGLDSDGRLVSRDSDYSVDNARSLRREIILDTYRSVRPHAVLIELFPFGRKKFAEELLPLLDEARGTGQSRPLVVCSLRDILVGRQGDQQKHDERAVTIANKYFDAVLVHSDPEFARLEESFHACSRLTTPVHYTGYVSPNRGVSSETNVTRLRRIVVSAGGGLVGYPLLQTAIESALALRDEALEMKVIAGPFLPEESWQSLCAAARGCEGVQVIRSVPDLYEEMRAAAASVSQCGYNTTLDILESGVPALVVPFSDGSEDEQWKRAERLERLGAVRVLDQRQMNATRLADEIKALLRFTPQAPALDLNGAKNSAQILERLLDVRQTGGTSPSRWLDPVRNALDSSPEPITFFFRDDDGGWDDDRLFKLLDLFAAYDLPIDLAIIPRALTPSLARKILGRIETNRERIGLHQHGFAHVNHEAQGRKCEFGPARARQLQEQDIAAGKRVLAELFGPIVQPIFTPPWNRCTAETGDCLIRLGFRILSRDYSAAPLDISGLSELSVRVDWFAKRKGVRLNADQLGALIADAIRDAKPVGVMFHHALMDGDERKAASELLALVAAHNQARCQPMQSLA